MDFLTLASQRYSCRKFTEEKISKEDLDKILEAVRVAPTAHNEQPQRVWVCQSDEAIARIRQTTQCHFNAPLVLIVGYKKEEAWVRPYDEKNYGEVDSAIIGSHIVLACQDLGLGSTWVAFYDPAKVAELFPETEGYEVVSLFPIGHPAETAHPAKLHSISKEIDDMTTIL